MQPEVARIIGVGGCRLISKIYNDNMYIVLFADCLFCVFTVLLFHVWPDLLPDLNKWLFDW